MEREIIKEKGEQMVLKLIFLLSFPQYSSSVKGRTLYIWHLKHIFITAIPVYTIANIISIFQTSERADLDQESAKYLDIMQIM